MIRLVFLLHEAFFRAFRRSMRTISRIFRNSVAMSKAIRKSASPKTAPKKSATKKTAKKTIAVKGKNNTSVEAFLQTASGPVKEIVSAARQIILNADKRLTEQIKWNAPSYCVDGDDRITFHVGKKGDVMLIFHLGAKAKDRKGKEPLMQDATGLLEWATSDRAILRLPDAAYVKAIASKLSTIVRQWIAASVR
jgi:hypothetical protein